MARHSRIARLIISIAVVTASVAGFAMLGGIGLANSSIRTAQYPVHRRISIVEAAPSRNGTVTLSVSIVGWRMYPTLVGKPLNKADGGHWVIVVDGKCNNVSANRTTGRTKVLKRGTHRVYTALAKDNGSYLIPPVKSDVVFVDVAPRPGLKVGAPSVLCLQSRG